jgi:hypothetical protein
MGIVEMIKAKVAARKAKAKEAIKKTINKLTGDTPLKCEAFLSKEKEFKEQIKKKLKANQEWNENHTTETICPAMGRITEIRGVGEPHPMLDIRLTAPGWITLQGR